MGRKIRRIMDGEVALPFRANNAGILSYASPLQRRAGLLGASLLLLLSLVYGYSVISSVMHVASREELMIEISKASSEVSRLESEYLTRTNGITESFARDRGYVAILERSFVERVEGITLNTSR